MTSLPLKFMDRVARLEVKKKKTKPTAYYSSFHYLSVNINSTVVNGQVYPNSIPPPRNCLCSGSF